jgi:hypothetical protein
MTIEVGDRFKSPNPKVSMIYEVVELAVKDVKVKVVGATSMFKNGTEPFWISRNHQILDEDWRLDE